MSVAVYLPLLASVLLGVAARPLARVLPPATAATALAMAAALVAAATGAALGVLALTLLGRLPAVAALGSWSVASLSAADPVPQLVAAAACAAVVLGGAAGLLRGWQRLQAVTAARALCQSLGGGPGQLVVLDDDRLDVYAVPGDHGRIVASRALLAVLAADERRALLAHETAHLRGRHHLYRTVVDLAAAVDPLLRPVTRAVRFATERWADEDAATATGDRASVARALAQVGLHKHGAAPVSVGWRSVVLDAARSDVVARVRALLAPAPRQHPAALLLLLALLAGTVAATVDAQADAEDLFEASRPAAAAPAAVHP